MVYTIENEKYRVGVLDMGAELTSWVDKEDGHEYIWQNREIWNGQAPLLFPIVGRLRDDLYEVNGKEYTLPKHGFARRSVFEMESKTESEITFLLKDSEETRKVYPFSFELRVHYTVTDAGVIMENRVTNTGAADMYFSLGTHPGFICQMGDKVVMDAEETAESYVVDENALRNEVTVPVWENGREVTITPTIFDNDALFFDKISSNGATLVRANGRNVHVDFGGAPCLGIWAKPGAEYVCIEPWFGINDRCDADRDFAKKEQICKAAPGEDFVFAITMSAI